MVVVYLLAIFSLFVVGKAVEHLNEPYFYIYEWPSALGDVYPPPNTVLHKSSSYDHAFYENRGIGRMLDPDCGLFQTWQFSLYKNAMQRLSTSRYRTR